MTTVLTLETTEEARAALVDIIRRAARRGRELRGVNLAADGVRVSEAHAPSAAGTPAPKDGTQSGGYTR